jgi:hypothetical protein
MVMRSIAVVEIEAPQAEVAARFADPRNTAKWMVDLDRQEPISGEPGMPGSKYRLISEHQHLNFEATVVERRLPDLVRLALTSPSISVAIDARFSALPSGRTKLTSTEVFRFKGVFGRAMALFARRSIHSAHVRQMEAFRRYAERAHKGVRGLVDYHPPATPRTPTPNPRPAQEAT